LPRPGQQWHDNAQTFYFYHSYKLQNCWDLLIWGRVAAPTYTVTFWAENLLPIHTILLLELKILKWVLKYYPAVSIHFSISLVM
jgi:hypothetical protein